MKKKIISSIFIFNTLIILLSYPFFYTNDGAAYLSSAKSLFTKDQTLAYEWLREPIYPLFLKIINIIFGSSSLNFIIIQSGLLIFSYVLIGLIFEDFLDEKYHNLFWSILFIISLFSQFFFQYSGLVLQQILFAFYSTIYAAIIKYTSKIRNTFIFTAIFFFISINTSIIFWYFNIIIIFLLILKFINIYKHQINLKILLNLGITFLTLTIIVLFSGSIWNNYKQKEVQKIQISSEIENQFEHTNGKENNVGLPEINPAFIIRLIKNDFFSESKIDAFTRMVLPIKTESENYYFFQLLMDDIFRCGGNVATEAVYYRNYSQFYFDYTCKSNLVRQNLHKKLTDLYFYFYQIIILMFILIGTLKILNFKKYYILIIPFTFMGLYYVYGGNVDRYLIPIFPFAASLVAVGFTNIISKLNSK